MQFRIRSKRSSTDSPITPNKCSATSSRLSLRGDPPQPLRAQQRADNNGCLTLNEFASSWRFSTTPSAAAPAAPGAARAGGRCKAETAKGMMTTP